MIATTPFSKCLPGGGKQPQRGVSLIELMIAMTLGLMVTAVIIQIFTASQDTYTTEEDYGRIQERGRFALEFLANDFRQAGYSGCRRLDPNSPDISVLATGGNAAVRYPRGALGFRYVGSGGIDPASDWSPALPVEYLGNIGGENIDLVPWSDVVVVEYAKSMDTPLANDTVPTSAQLQIYPPKDPGNAINNGDILMVTDCRNADIFKATGASNSGGKMTISHGAAGNTSPMLDHTYDNRAEILKLAGRVYFVGITTNPANPNPEPTLYRLGTDTNMTSLPLVEGIERLQYLWGVDLNNDLSPDQYVEANQVAPNFWRSVVSVRIGMVVNTSDSRPLDEADQKTYNIFGETESGADNYGPTAVNAGGYGTNNFQRRRVFTTAVGVRNVTRRQGT